LDAERRQLRPHRLKPRAVAPRRAGHSQPRAQADELADVVSVPDAVGALDARGTGSGYRGVRTHSDGERG